MGVAKFKKIYYKLNVAVDEEEEDIQCQKDYYLLHM